ncbi:MAG TPA: TIGR03617 family F420-dependent LLM class oxidoreductase [Pseudonocardia sp.]|nr:TIGR03617 family F420-dependent LLM class oxidoreductase [Pseudonocardia sp.]
MKVDLTLQGAPGDWDLAKDGERRGYDGVWLPETTHDPFNLLAIAGNLTERVTLGTAIAVAFGRNPMSLAMTGNDLQLYTKGRFILGVGSQVRAHITKRFSMPWSAPAERMHEFIRAIRAIWHTWETGESLRFVGDFYTHTLMTPMFNPGPNPYGNPPIVLAGVGPKMTEVAGELADGYFVHAFTTERYLREVTVPTLLAGRQKVGKTDLDGYDVIAIPFVVTGDTAEQVANADAAMRKQIAFYASTPAYRTVLELHGWGELGQELNVLSKRGEWDEMGRRIPDEVLAEFAVIASPKDVAGEIHRRFGDVFTRASIYAPYSMPEGFWDPIVRELREL